MHQSFKILTQAEVLILNMAGLQAASPWSGRLRATYLETADKSDAFLGTRRPHVGTLPM